MKTLVGKVVSVKTQTVVVKVDRPVRHPVYKKTVKRSKKYLADNNLQNIKEGDLVKLKATKPVSRKKRWRVVEVVEIV